MATPLKRKKPPEDEDTSDFVCDDCQKSFSNKSNLTRHQEKAVCLKNSGGNLEPSIPTLVTNNKLNCDIINSINDEYLKFVCAQRLGCYKQHLTHCALWRMVTTPYLVLRISYQFVRMRVSTY